MLASVLELGEAGSCSSWKMSDVQKGYCGWGEGVTPKTLNPKPYTLINPHIYHKPPTPEDPHVDCIVRTIACARSIAGAAKDEGPASAASVEGIHM